MKAIDVSTQKYPNTFALVDDEDFLKIAMCCWHAKEGSCGTIYAARTIYINKKRKSQYMHRFILNAMPNQAVDHRDCDGLNNQKFNIRTCTVSENRRNQRKRIKTTSSEFKGVYWYKNNRRWGAHIGINGVKKHIGMFSDEISAAKAYDIKAKELFGEFARTNF
jgi:hypothetical protein